MDKRPQIDSFFVDKDGRLTRIWRAFIERVGDSIKVFEDESSRRSTGLGRFNEVDKLSSDIYKTNRSKNSMIEIEKMIDMHLRSAISPLRSKMNELEKEIEDIRRGSR